MPPKKRSKATPVFFPNADADNAKEACKMKLEQQEVALKQNPKHVKQADAKIQSKATKTDGQLQSSANKQTLEKIRLGYVPNNRDTKCAKPVLALLEHFKETEVLVVPRIPEGILKALLVGIGSNTFQQAFNNKKHGSTSIDAIPAEDDESDGEGHILYSFYNTKITKTELRTRSINNAEKGETDGVLDHVMLARELGAHRPAASKLFDTHTAFALTELNSFLNSAMISVFHKMKREDGKLQDVSKWIDDESERNISNQTALSNIGLKYDTESGYMEEGSHREVETIFSILRTDIPFEQKLHIDCKYAKIRAQDLLQQGEGFLESESFKVGYNLHMPLNLEGSILSVLIEFDGVEQIVDFHIPFGSALLTRMDVYHAGFYGTPGSYRISGVVLTPKTMYSEIGKLAEDDEDVEKEALTRYCTPRPKNIADFEEWLPMRVHGETAKTAISLVNDVLDTTLSPEYMSVVLRFMGLPKRPEDETKEAWKIDRIKQYQLELDNRARTQCKNHHRKRSVLIFQIYDDDEKKNKYKQVEEQRKKTRQDKTKMGPTAGQLLEAKVASRKQNGAEAAKDVAQPMDTEDEE